MIVLGQFAIFAFALAGIIAGSLGGLYFGGRALNRAQVRRWRFQQGGLALLCLCLIVASAAMGFVGVGAIMYWAQR